MHVNRLLVCIAWLAAAGGIAHAGPVHTVVVTATRMEQPAFAIPAAIDVVDGDALRQHQLRVNLSEALGRVPGLNVQNRYNYAQDLQVSSRGFGARASFGVRGVRLIQDGIPLTMPDGQGQTGLFDLDAADRVEVLRGPFAALYGNSSGGVIQLITASARKPSLELATAAGEDGIRRYGAQLATPAGAFDLYGNLSRFETDGFRAHSAARRDVANVKLGFTRDGASLTVIANALDQPDTQDPIGLTQAELDADPTQVAPIVTQLNTRKSTRHVQGGLVYEEKFSDHNRLRAVGYSGDRDLTQFLANSSTALSGSGGVVDLARKFGGGGLQWSLSGAGAAPYQLTVGVDYDRMKEHRRGFVNVAGTRGALRRDENDTVYGLNSYAIAEWQFAPRWQIAGGVRHSDVRFRVADDFIVGTNPDDSGKLSFESTQPVVGLTFSVTPAVNLFVSGGRAFETPTFAELAYRPDGLPGLNFALEAATSKNFEAGAKLLFGEQTRMTATLFRSVTEQDIVTGPSPFPGRNTFVNAARTQREGAELAAETMSHGFEVYFAYTYTRARFAEFINFAGVDLSNRRLPGVPAQSAYAEVNWRHSLSGFVTGLEARWVDKFYADDANSAAAPDYAVLNLHAGLRQRLGGWQLNEFLRIDNVLDERYVGSVIVNAANARYFEPAPRRTLFLGFTANYSR